MTDAPPIPVLIDQSSNPGSGCCYGGLVLEATPIYTITVHALGDEVTKTSFPAPVSSHEANPFMILLDKLDSFKTVQDLDCDDELPTRESVERMKNILSKLNQVGLVPSRLSPSAEGGVAVAFRNENRYSDIEVLNKNVTMALTSNRNGEIDAWEVGHDKSLGETVETIRQYLGL